MEAIVRSIPVYYEEYGTGIPILMIHGMPSDHHHMIDVMEPLFQHRTGWRRIYPDVPGMGKTPGAAWITNNDQMLEVISEFMQTVAPNQRFIVTGLSYGGYYARGLIYQQCSMIDGLLLVVPVGIPEMTKRQVPPHLLLVKDDQFLSALTPGDTEVFTNLFVVQSVEGLEWFRTNFQVPFDAADHVFWHIPGVTSFSFPVDLLSAPFPAPTLILTGRQDSLCGYDEAWGALDNYPRGTFAVLDRGGHFAFFEQKLLFEALTNEWLNRVEEYVAQNAVLNK